MSSLEPRRLRNWIVVGGLIAAIAAGVIFYPYLIAGASARTVALVLLGLIGATRLLGRSGLQAALGHGAAPAIAIPFLLLATAFSGESVFLRLVPSAIYASLAEMCRLSLRDGSSIIERAVQYMVPEAPEFIRNYCRNLTTFWCGFFVGCSLAVGLLAVSDDVDLWRRFTGAGIYATMALVTVIEFFVRKTWFRYYFHQGPFDRVWSSLFPAEDTPRGRQSMAYIQQYQDRKPGL